MKISIILVLIFCTGSNASAQHTFEVTYSQTRVMEGSSLYDLKIPKAKKPALPWHSIITEDTTFVFSTQTEKGKKYQLKKGRYPVRPLDHSFYYSNKDQSIYEIVSFMGDFFIYSKDSVKTKSTIFWMDTTSTILNYECQSAIVVNAGGDSSAMWIARNVKPGLETFHENFIVPGIVMESLDLKRGIFHQAVNVEKTGNQIYFPSDYLSVSLEEYVKEWDKKTAKKKWKTRERFQTNKKNAARL